MGLDLFEMSNAAHCERRDARPNDGEARESQGKARVS
jgi:hypothetical protein